MGKFGPGTSKPLSLKRKDWKATGNAIENKNRPEAVYVVLSSWVKPKLSVGLARRSATQEVDTVAKQSAKEFVDGIEALKKKAYKYFNSEYFDTSSVIFTYDFALQGVSPGKRQFVEIEINIDTVNTINMNDEPAPTPSSGKINQIPFKDFVKPMEEAINKMLMEDVFSTAKSTMEFSPKKGG